MNAFQMVVLWSDALLGVLLVALLAGIVAATRREHLRRAWSAVFASRIAMASLVVQNARAAMVRDLRMVCLQWWWANRRWQLRRARPRYP